MRPDLSSPLTSIPFVGRQDALAALEAAWQRARSGQLSLILLAGEAGSGKTRLADEFAARIGADQAQVLRGQAAELQGSDPYHPIAAVVGELLDRVVSTQHAGTTQAPSHAPGALHAALRSWNLDPDTHARPLEALLMRGGLERAQYVERADIGRHLLLETMARLLQAACDRRPLLILLDDMQWAHELVFAALDYLVHTLPTGRVLFVVAYRPEEVSQGRDGMAHPLARRRRGWMGDLDAVHLELPPLTPHDVSVAMRRSGVDDGLCQQLVAATGGHALFVVEYIRLLADGGREVEKAIPPQTQAILDRRLDPVSTEDELLLRSAALLGEEFDATSLAAVLGEPTGGLMHRLSRLCEVHRLLVTRQEGVYRFGHALIRDALLRRIDPEARRRMYVRAAESLERLAGMDAANGRARPADVDAASILRLAFLYGQGEDAPRAAWYSHLAARVCLDQEAPEEAARHAQAALDLVRTGDDWDTVPVPELYRGVADVLHLVVGEQSESPLRPLAMAACAEALAHATDPLDRADICCWQADLEHYYRDKRRDHLLAAEAELSGREDVVQTARLWVRQAKIFSGDPRRQAQLAAAALQVFEHIAPDDPDAFIAYRWGLKALGAMRERGPLRKLQSSFETWTAARGDVGASLACWDVIAEVAYVLSEHRREVAVREKALQVARELRYHPAAMWQHYSLSCAYAILGDYERAATHANEMGEWGSDLCLPVTVHQCVASHAVLSDDPGVARRHLKAALKRLSPRLYPPMHHDGVERYGAPYLTLHHVAHRLHETDALRRAVERLQDELRAVGARLERTWDPCPGAPDPDAWDVAVGPADTWNLEDPLGVGEPFGVAGGLGIRVRREASLTGLSVPRYATPVEGDAAVAATLPGADAAHADMSARLAAFRAGRPDYRTAEVGAGGLLLCDARANGAGISVHSYCPGAIRFFTHRAPDDCTTCGIAWIHDGPISVRLERRGVQVTGYCHSPATGWRCLGTTKARIEAQARAGVYADGRSLLSTLTEGALCSFVNPRIFRPVGRVSTHAVNSSTTTEITMLRELADVGADPHADVAALEEALLGAMGASLGADWASVEATQGGGQEPARLNWTAPESASDNPSGTGQDVAAEAVQEASSVQAADHGSDSGMEGAPPQEGGGDEDADVIELPGPTIADEHWRFGRSDRFDAAERGLAEQGLRLAAQLLQRFDLEQQVSARQLHPSVSRPSGDEFPAIIGRSPAMLELLEEVRRAARSGAPTFIQGESGSGKELVARAIHDGGQRSRQPFVAQNCAALPDNLLESELFGHRKGAFTGATADKLGLFEVASGGTIFLDEVAEASPAVQAKLLRAVEEREIRRVGDTHARPVDVRILSATSQNLARRTKAGSLRPDLVYRLNVIRIVVPPLRERVEDIPELADRFLERIRRRDSLDISGFSNGAVDVLCAYSWPGNVRELINEVERAAARATPGCPIDVQDLSPALRNLAIPRARQPAGVLQQHVAHLERTLIRDTLDRCDGNLSRTARELGLSRPGLKGKMERYGLVTGRGAAQEQ